MSYCCACQRMLDWTQFRLMDDDHKGFQVLKCQFCTGKSINLKCSGCQFAKNYNYDLKDSILKCDCSQCTRFHKCPCCKNDRITSDHSLKQTSLITCQCNYKTYIQNCPNCKQIYYNKNMNQLIECNQCQIKFQWKVCGQQCDLDAYTIYNPFQLIPQYRCLGGHITYQIECPQTNCHNQVSIIDLNLPLNVKCIKCALRLQLLTCLCGKQNQIAKQIGNISIKCQQCHSILQIMDCSYDNCEGIIYIPQEWQEISTQQSQVIGLLSFIVSTCSLKQHKQIIQKCSGCSNAEILPEGGKLKRCKKTQCQITHKSVCAICYDNPAEYMFTPCNHISVCVKCKCGNFNYNCPICKRKYNEIIKVYFD